LRIADTTSAAASSAAAAPAAAAPAAVLLLLLLCRVKSTQIAMEKAGDDIKGSVLASDAFFPFSWRDSVEMACQVRYKAVT
jgi:hypothetical protein